MEDQKIGVKTKLSALWVSVMFLYVYGDYFTLYVPGKLEGMIAGKFVSIETSGSVLLSASVLMAVPSLMIFLSLALAPKANRRLNIAMGVVYSIVMLLTMLMDVWSFYIFLGGLEILLTALIVWNAWNWPKETG